MSTRMRIGMALMALAGSLLLGGGMGQASASPAQEVYPVPVDLEVHEASVSILQLELTGLSATVREVPSGAPVMGGLVTFSTDSGRRLGTAWTDYTGTASINAPVEIGPELVTDLFSGYNASFYGEGYIPATEHGGITFGL